MKYKIFYSDEACRGKRGVQAIVQLDPKVSWYVESHGDYYLFKDDELWHAADFDGLWTELKKRNLVRPHIGVRQDVWVDEKWKRVGEPGFHEWIETLNWVLCGETIDNERFHEIFQQALADADFGRKNGYLPREHKP